MMRIRTVTVVCALLGVSLAVGCGGDDENADKTTAPQTTTTTTQSTTAQSPSNALTIKMSDYAFAPQDAVASAGTVAISAPNEGQVEHELVLLKTDADPAKLPTKNGEIDESTSVGEIPDVAPGETKNAMFKLEPGKYVMVCGLPGHYESGMYGTLTVK